MRASFCLSCGFVEAPEFYYHHHNSALRQYLTHTLFRACVGRQLQPFPFAVKKTCERSREKKKENNYHKFHFIQTLSCLSSHFLTLHIWTCQNPLSRPNSPLILICFPKEGRVYLENKHMCVTGSTWSEMPFSIKKKIPCLCVWTQWKKAESRYYHCFKTDSCLSQVALELKRNTITLPVRNQENIVTYIQVVPRA